MGVLPKGQQKIDDFPRFGLRQFLNRLPDQTDCAAFEVRGDVENALSVEERFLDLPRTTQRSDLHCVTTWSTCGLEWAGVRFRDFYEQFVLPDARPDAGADFVVIRGQDGFRTSLPLNDLMTDDVLLADTLDGEPLSIAHGAPVRLVAPSHYGYKNIKHLRAIEFWRDSRNYRYPGPKFLDHPRARVEHEERSAVLPNWFARPLYRLLIPSTRRLAQTVLDRHLKKIDEEPQ